MSKLCPDCGETKPLDEFYDDKSKSNGKRSYCKPCGYARAVAYREANREKYAETQRRNSLKRRYGITVEQYDEMLAEQDGKCACCGTTEPGGHGGFHVDHCHDTGEVRGLLCHSCNAAIGGLGDNLEGVWNAMLYLVKYERMVTA